ncbi:LysR substrate-binding domain-containing protein [Aliamphritea ceti]|uniref:LysR substrate-binding domain-containing protein n=1 Tax=Aliamphritea ceti TaxID=1524258 RepID=UPI0021C3C4C9|nr:LysR substrate-binding domain-containing protein [Aliamphritea ceti]
MEKAINHRQLPPLKTLSGFEATARLLSFRKAAQELNLSHPAISHQILALETNLGVKLFNRKGRQMVLTAEGERFYPIARRALEELINGSEVLRRSASIKPLRIQTYISVSIRWLSHRLSRFRAAHPDIELQLISSIEEQDFDETNADIGLIFSRASPDTHLAWEPLIQPALRPVCHPSLVGNQTNLLPEEILQYPLITVTSERWQWQDWFEAAGFCASQPNSALSTDSTAIALEMAMDGEGIALLNGPFANKDLLAGRLIHPSEHCVRNLGEWGLTYRKDSQPHQNIRAFVDWILKDIAKHP